MLMNPEIADILDHPVDNPHPSIQKLGVTNFELCHKNLYSIATSGITLDLLNELFLQLSEILPSSSDPDRALNNLERFVTGARSPLALAALIDRDRTCLPILLTIFSTSQYLSDLLIRDTESYDALRLSEGQLHTRDVIVDELMGEIVNAADNNHAMTILRRFKHRETLRIAFGDLIVGHRVEQVTEQISYVADAVCSAAVFWARQQLEKKWGVATDSHDTPVPYVILAMGKLGGVELNYSSDIDLIMVYQHDGQTSQGRSNREFFERLTREFAKLLNEATELGAAYRVDMRLRPDGKQGRICNSFETILQYYDLKGRTWERQALIKARPVAGDLELGHRLIGRLQSWIYRSNLSRAEIGGIQALKRQIERRARVEGQENTNVKTGHGGIRDVEFVIQFLQLLNGHDFPEVRTGNTIDAIRNLLRAGCLTMPEATLLIQNYSWLRKVEHRLQVMFDLQTHTIPTQPEELEKLAVRMGYSRFFGKSPLTLFDQQLTEVTSSNRQILDHVLHRPFGDSGDSQEVPLIVDALLHPEPDAELIQTAMKDYRFEDIESSFKNLKALGRERTIFLSQSRCRHFLAAIAHPLLTEISKTPDPNSTLVSLCSISDSLGAKAVLWELFNSNPASLKLYVRLCASSNYLAQILTSNPGMIDALIDSMMMEHLPTWKWLDDQLTELARGAEDLEPIIHSFKHSQHLRIGVRDILRKDPIEATHQALSDVAEICLRTVTRQQFQRLSKKHFVQDDPSFTCEQSGFAVLAMGKLGGREPNYHSDLDVVFLYETTSEFGERLKPEITPQYFFSELAAGISKYMTTAGRYGKLYDMDSRLRPTGKSGSLAVSIAEFVRYFDSGDGQLWERQALCKARPVFGNDELRKKAAEATNHAIASVPWVPEMAIEIQKMRMAMQENCSPRNLKRGIGGTVDIEFGIQMLQLKSAKTHPDVVVPGTIEAIHALIECGCLDEETGMQVAANYRLLRNVEARLRLMNTTARHDLPNAGNELVKLAYLLNYASGEKLESDTDEARAFNRNWFTELVERAAKN